MTLGLVEAGKERERDEEPQASRGGPRRLFQAEELLIYVP